MDDFIPVTQKDVDTIDRMSLWVVNGQVYISAAAMRFMGMPKAIGVFVSSGGDRMMIANMEGFDLGVALVVPVSKRKDSDGGRCAGFPRTVSDRIPDSRTTAIETIEGSGIVFPLDPAN